MRSHHPRHRRLRHAATAGLLASVTAATAMMGAEPAVAAEPDGADPITPPCPVTQAVQALAGALAPAPAVDSPASVAALDGLRDEITLPTDYCDVYGFVASLTAGVTCTLLTAGASSLGPLGTAAGYGACGVLGEGIDQVTPQNCRRFK